MINTLLEHVPLPIKLEVLEALQNDSDGTDSDILDDETTLMISSDEEAELEAQRIRFHELVGRNLQLRERGRSTSSSGSSAVVVMSEKEGTNAAAAESDEVGETVKRCKDRVYSTTSVASSTGTSISEMESCGNICIHEAQARLVFNCSFCELRYADMQLFAEHLHDSHKLFTASTPTEVVQSEQPQNMTVTASVSTEATAVKKELDVLVVSGPVDAQEHLESCGNIFVLKRQKLFLICGYCECKYATLELFSRHLRQQHQLLEGPIKEILVEPKEEIKCEVTAIDNPAIEHNKKQDDGPQPMVAIPKGMALDNNDLIPMISLSCCSNSNSSGVHTPPQRVSTETPPPEEGEAKLQTATRSKRKRSEPTNLRPMSRRLRKTTAPELEPPVATVAKRVRRTSANKPKLPSKDLNVQPPSSPESATTERLDLEQHSAPIVELVNDIANEREQEQNLETEPEPEQHSAPIAELVNDIANDKEQTQNLETEPEPEPEQQTPPTNAKQVKKNPSILHCDQCLKKFTKASLYNEHKRTHTGEKPFKCYVCGKSFRVKMRLVEHAMRHRVEKAFKCDLCGHPMATKQDLVLHLRHHKGDKRYICPHCPKAFVRGSDLKIHVRIHTGEKPYSCEICQKAFRANQNLIVHRKTHRDEKPFKCEYCDKHFMRNIDRKVHHRTHTGERPYKCEICERAYSSRVHLRSHLNRDHVEGGRPRKKPGPKPKHIKEEMERQKQLIEDLKVQVIEHIQHQPAPRQKTSTQVQQRAAAAKTTLREQEQQQRKSKRILSEEVAMQQVSLALKIALEDDDVANDDNDILGELFEKENDSPQLVVAVTAATTDAGVIQRKQRNVTATQKERKITSYFTVVGQKTEI